MRRSHLLGLAASAATATLTAAPVRAQTLRPLRIVLFTGETAGTAYYAQDLGMFQKAGLEVTITTVTNGAAGASAVVGGAVDIGFSNPLSIAQGFSRGVPFQVIAPAAIAVRGEQTNGYVIVAKNSSIRTGKDMLGKSFALDGVGGLPYLAVRNWIDSTGGDSGSVKFVELAFSEMLPAIEAGRVDVSEMNTAFDPLIGKPDDPAHLLGNSYDLVAPRFASTVWFSTKSWLASNEDLARRFVAAMHESALWANGHPNDVPPILARYTKQSIAAIKSSHRVTFGIELAPGLIQPVIDLAARYKLMAAAFPASQMITALSTPA